MLYGREGSRRSGIALAMRHGLSGLSTYGLNGLRKGDEHPAYAPCDVWHPLSFERKFRLLLLALYGRVEVFTI